MNLVEARRMIPANGGRPVTFEIDGRRVRDLNGNGRLDPYEDPRLPVDERVDDLLAQMTLEEKAGLMFHPPIGIGSEGELLEGPSAFGGEGTTRLVAERHLNHFNIYGAPDARRTAEWHNRLQQVAEGTRLGFPVTISSDPRHSFEDGPATISAAGSFSAWPEPIGLGATGDEELVRGFGEIARQEYRAVGIHVALHPMADIASEPRWARSVGTFGEDVELVGRLTAGVHPRLPGRRARADERRVHGEALSRRRATGRRGGPAARCGHARLRRRDGRGGRRRVRRRRRGAADADVALVVRHAPYEPRTSTFIESLFHAGSLDFPAGERDRVLEIARAVPTVLVVPLDRPAILSGLTEACSAVVGAFGASPDAVLDLVFGRFSPSGRLPFELPSSMDAVEKQLPDVPCDSEAPLFPLAHGLSFDAA